MSCVFFQSISTLLSSVFIYYFKYILNIDITDLNIHIFIVAHEVQLAERNIPLFRHFYSALSTGN